MLKIVETPAWFGPEDALFGIFSEPLSNPIPGVAVVFINAGLLYHVGPNRLIVNLSRELAENGLPGFRFDFAGNGNSERIGQASRPRGFVQDTRSALDHLQKTYGADRILLVGICSGARLALELAATDNRVIGAALLEGVNERTLRYYLSRVFSPAKWKRFFSGKSHIVGKILGRFKARQVAPAQISAGASLESGFIKSIAAECGPVSERLKLLKIRKVPFYLIYRQGNEMRYNYRTEPQRGIITGKTKIDTCRVAFIPGADHTFTPVASQKLLLAELIDWAGYISNDNENRAK